MRVKTLLIVGLVLLGWSGAPAFAQELELVPKNNVGILIEILQPSAAYCNVTKSSLDTAVRLPLSRNGFRLNPEPPFSMDYLYVSLNILQLRGALDDMPMGCAINVKLEYIRTVRLLSGTLIHSGATVWRAERLLTGSPLDMSRMVRDSLETATEDWIAKWLIDNPQ